MLSIAIILLLVLAITIPLIVFKKRIGEKRITIILGTMGVVLYSLGVFRNFLNDNFIWVINGGTYGEVYYNSSDVLQSLLRWGLFFAYIVYPCAAFFKVRTLKNWAIYFCLPVALISLFYYKDFISYFTTSSGRAIMTANWIRHVEFSLELILTIAFPILLRTCTSHKFNVKDKREWLNFFGLLPLALLVAIPVTLPQSLFGFSKYYMSVFSAFNIAWILVCFLIIMVLYFMFRFKNREIRYTLCVFLALYLFIHYNSIYLMDLVAKRLPFQLCNLGAYLILLALLIKKQSFFNFVLIANIPGAIIACLVPDVKEGVLSYWNIHFIMEHTWVLVIPLLCIALRIFERPGKNAIKHFFVGFTIYFLFCATAGIIFNAFLYKPNHSFFNEVNYFYLFDNTVLKVITLLRFTRNFTFALGGYSFYPLYMLSVYVLFSTFCMIVYYVFKNMCKIGDSHFELRKIKIELLKERGKYNNGRTIPRTNYED